MNGRYKANGNKSPQPEKVYVPSTQEIICGAGEPMTALSATDKDRHQPLRSMSTQIVDGKAYKVDSKPCAEPNLITHGGVGVEINTQVVQFRASPASITGPQPLLNHLLIPTIDGTTGKQRLFIAADLILVADSTPWERITTVDSVLMTTKTLHTFSPHENYFRRSVRLDGFPRAAADTIAQLRIRAS